MEVVRSSIFHANGSTILGIKAGIAVVFHVALSAQDIGIRFIEKADDPEGLPTTLKLDFVKVTLSLFSLS